MDIAAYRKFESDLKPYALLSSFVEMKLEDMMRVYVLDEAKLKEAKTELEVGVFLRAQRADLKISKKKKFFCRKTMSTSTSGPASCFAACST